MSNDARKEMTDEQLLARIGAADHEALELLYKRYFHRIFRFVYRMMRSLDDIEEIINDVMFVVWQKAPGLVCETQVSTWIFGIAYKKCLKVLSGKIKSKSIMVSDELENLPERRISGLKDLEMADWLSEVFSQLPVEQKAVLELAYHQGLHYGEIAKIMGCPESTVKTRMFYARKKIKSLFPDLAGELNSDSVGKSL